MSEQQTMTTADGTVIVWEEDPVDHPAVKRNVVLWYADGRLIGPVYQRTEDDTWHPIGGLDTAHIHAPTLRDAIEESLTWLRSPRAAELQEQFRKQQQERGLPPSS